MPKIGNFSLFQICCVFPTILWLVLAILTSMPKTLFRRLPGIVMERRLRAHLPVVTPSFRIDKMTRPFLAFQLSRSAYMLTLNPFLTPTVRNTWTVEAAKEFDEFMRHNPSTAAVNQRLAQSAATQALNWLRQRQINPAILSFYSRWAKEDEIDRLFPKNSEEIDPQDNLDPPPVWAQPVPPDSLFVEDDIYAELVLKNSIHWHRSMSSMISSAFLEE